MRTIILLQSIIIILGGYYLYTLTHTVTVQSPAPVINMVATTTPAAVHEGYVAPKTQPPSDEPASTSKKGAISGPNDSGMEYPDQPLRSE